MREIKFRAWDDKNKKWLLGYELENLGGFSLTGECVLVDGWAETAWGFMLSKDGKKPKHLIVEQYTGLKDKNGKELYENDKIEDNVGREWVIKYCPEQATFLFHYAKNERQSIPYGKFIMSQLPLKQIGNIHEPKEKHE